VTQKPSQSFVFPPARDSSPRNDGPLILFCHFLAPESLFEAFQRDIICGMILLSFPPLPIMVVVVVVVSALSVVVPVPPHNLSH